ncbi:unnamed protein product [Adineta ricciae]|uniref:Thioesterase domain-containing protein n=1 Tax=Adineta ricciae TaxID=249248 RepID=A0A814FJI7_ADIRI|nr:unnamed protein product [Adineta ricciae]CAF1068188.1 unnamed protein product [Adineta ricciae]
MSVIEAYQKNQKLKEIIDRQEHQYYFHNDTKTNQQQQIPAVFKQISAKSQLPEKVQHLVSSSSGHSTKTITIDEFMDLTLWNDRGKGKFPGLLGMEILSLSHGHTTCQLEVREEFLAPNGYLHAGVVVTLADTACGYGCVHSRPPGAKLFTTIELKSNFLGTIKPPGTIFCEARLAHGGKTTQVWDAKVKDVQKNKIIALFRCTQLILY